LRVPLIKVYKDIISLSTSGKVHVGEKLLRIFPHWIILFIR